MHFGDAVLTPPPAGGQERREEKKTRHFAASWSNPGPDQAREPDPAGRLVDVFFRYHGMPPLLVYEAQWHP